MKCVHSDIQYGNELHIAFINKMRNRREEEKKHLKFKMQQMNWIEHWKKEKTNALNHRMIDPISKTWNDGQQYESGIVQIGVYWILDILVYRELKGIDYWQRDMRYAILFTCFSFRLLLCTTNVECWTNPSIQQSNSEWHWANSFWLRQK